MEIWEAVFSYGRNQVRKRLGNGGEYKEISWLGETFVLRHIKGDIETLIPELSQLLSLSHPNILQFLCGFTDEEKKECFLISEQMSRNLGTHVRELYSPRKRIPVSLPVAVDMMLQIARGMEYLHSKNIFHGNLKPSNILARTRNDSSESYSYTQVKVTRFGLSSVTSPSQKGPNPSEELSYIWHAPEVLTEYEESKNDAQYTEKSDVYSYGMICFELLTGKVPFEDAHLQGDKMGRNIRAGERPLFPHQCPKYVTNLTKRCWHSDQDQRPSFSSICRILRCIKRFLAMNPDYSHPDSPVPQVDYCDIETAFLKKFPSWISNKPCPMNLGVKRLLYLEMSLQLLQTILFCCLQKRRVQFLCAVANVQVTILKYRAFLKHLSTGNLPYHEGPQFVKQAAEYDCTVSKSVL